MKKSILSKISVLTIFLLSSVLVLAQENTVLYTDLSINSYTDVYDRNNPYYIVVNKQNAVGQDYKPDNLVIPNVKFAEAGVLEKKHMEATAARNLELLFKAAAKDNIHLVAVSGYRSYNRQKTLYNNYVKQYGQAATDRFSAKPGHSEHQTGLAMDVSSKSVSYQLVQKFAETKEGQWLAKHAHEYGFIIRYPKDKEHITGYMYEPWHIRYVGKELATYLYTNHLTMEEMDSFFVQAEESLWDNQKVSVDENTDDITIGNQEVTGEGTSSHEEVLNSEWISEHKETFDMKKIQKENEMRIQKALSWIKLNWEKAKH